MKGRQRNMAIRSGINRQGWETSDFPIACEKCYGSNPYIRMLKQNYGQQCRICFRPFTVFKWKGNKGFYKRTCVCQTCCNQKNLCQICTLDLEFGLPIQTRDKRCGVNGKYLLNENFLTQDSKKIKPPPPSFPPVRNKSQFKEIVFIPDKDIQSEENQPTNENGKQKQKLKQLEIKKSQIEKNQIDGKVLVDPPLDIDKRKE